MPLQIPVPLLLKVLSYDRALGRNGDGDLVITVLHDAANAGSADAKNAFVKALRGGSVSAVNGRTIQVAEINITARQIGSSLKDKNATAACVTSGLDGRIKDIVRGGSDEGDADGELGRRVVVKASYAF